MWFENADDENTPKTSVRPADEEQSETILSAAESRPHPKSLTPDPTKAFEDDADEVPGGPASTEEIASLKATIKELDNKANANYDRYLRALAEMDNFKKRMARERLDQMRYAGEDLLNIILPVIDNLERTLAHSHEQSDLTQVLSGVELIQKQFSQALTKAGITVIDQASVPFDPNLHQALQRIEDKSLPDDTVVEILQKGYVLNGKVVRPAMVKVAKHH
jgi:molecular chaperone GrpE